MSIFPVEPIVIAPSDASEPPAVTMYVPLIVIVAPVAPSTTAFPAVEISAPSATVSDAVAESAFAFDATRRPAETVVAPV